MLKVLHFLLQKVQLKQLPLHVNCSGRTFHVHAPFHKVLKGNLSVGRVGPAVRGTCGHGSEKKLNIIDINFNAGQVCHHHRVLNPSFELVPGDRSALVLVHDLADLQELSLLLADFPTMVQNLFRSIWLS